MIKEVVLITSRFPYYPGEQFLETEIKYWVQNDNVKLTIMPTAVGNDKREIPKNISLDISLINRSKNVARKMIYILTSLFSPMFYKELYTEVLKNPKRFYHSLTSFVNFLHFRKMLKSFLSLNTDKKYIFYTYWHNEVTYALQSLKKEHDIQVVTRTHRLDIYKERRQYNYMPLRRQFLNKIDKIFTITNSAEDYLSTTYGFDTNIIMTARLGVDDHGIITQSNEEHMYHIVSCSFLIHVKQVDKLIDAILELSLIQKEIKIIWTHIGTGVLEKKLKIYAYNRFKNVPNLAYKFLGDINNRNVYEFYKNNKVDVFINTSTSEGVPVSIMEAMSCHIPIIAPKVGGINDMIESNFNGTLLSQNPKIEEIVKSLSLIKFYKNEKTRNNSYFIFKKYYDAKNNYPEFISKIIKISNS